MATAGGQTRHQLVNRPWLIAGRGKGGAETKRMISGHGHVRHCPTRVSATSTGAQGQPDGRWEEAAGR